MPIRPGEFSPPGRVGLLHLELPIVFSGILTLSGISDPAPDLTGTTDKSAVRRAHSFGLPEGIPANISTILR
jgi:hypothetical protein